ncbi:MAG: DUF4386 domain-containing protein [Cyclobacteriaceae bacterium]
MKTTNYALIAGWSLLLMAVTAGFAFGYAHSSLVLPDNPSLTLTNIQDAIGLFGLEIIGWFIILITDILVAWSLYRFFQSVDKKASLITGVIRVVYSAGLAFAIYHLLVVWHLVSKAHPDAYAVMELITNFEKCWSLGLIIFGLHLVGLGYLSYKSKAIPKWIGFLLYVAGVSYTLIHLGKAVIPEAIEIIAAAERMMSVPMAISELGFAIWLLRKGVNMDFTNNLN